MFRDSATHDSLTNLYNRHALDALAKEDQEYGILMIDIDHFKKVNDGFGHPAGDEVLRRIAAAIVSAVRSTDSVIRYGGEEILVLVSAADQTLTAAVAERIRSSVEALEFPSIPGLGSVTVSVGASIHHHGQPVEAAIADADEGLYRAKNGGRNQVRSAWPMPGIV